MSEPIRRRNGLRIVDLMLLVAAAALMISACTGTWTRPSACLFCEVSFPEGSLPFVSSRTLLSDEVLDHTSRLLYGGGGPLSSGNLSAPQQLRSALTVTFCGFGAYEVRTQTGDPAVDRMVLASWTVAVQQWLKRHQGGSDDDERFRFAVYGNDSHPEPFGAATPLIVFVVMLAAGLAVVWVLIRALSYRKDVPETAVEPHVGAG
jgi:hypothetical protein